MVTASPRQRPHCDVNRDTSQCAFLVSNYLELLGPHMVSLLYRELPRELDMNHLANITIRQRNSRVRDAVFAAFVALGAIVSVMTLSTVASAAPTHLIEK